MRIDPDTAGHVNSSRFRACEVAARRTCSRLLAASAVLLLTPQSEITKFGTDAPRVHVGGSSWSAGLQSWPQSVEPEPISVSVGPPTYEVIPATIAHEAITRDAVDRFTAAGLDLPSLQIVFSDDVRACGGHLGLFESDRHPWRVTICSDLAFVPVHELAHAWIEANIDEPTRERYLQVRNKTAWSSPNLDWNERGVEDAAFVIQQNLTTNHTGELDDEWNSRATAYELLTGTTSPIRNDPVAHSTNVSSARTPSSAPAGDRIAIGIRNAPTTWAALAAGPAGPCDEGVEVVGELLRHLNVAAFEMPGDVGLAGVGRERSGVRGQMPWRCPT